MADIRISPVAGTLAFTSSLGHTQVFTQDSTGALVLQGSGDVSRSNLFAVDGINGRLFSIDDDLSDSLFSVNTIAGLPVIEAFADNSITMGQYGQNVFKISGTNVGIGTASPSAKLDVSGGITASESIIVGSTALLNFGPTSNFVGLSGNNSTGVLSFFANSTTERMRITNAGNIGVNTTNPYAGTGVTSVTINATSYPILAFQNNGSRTGEVIGYYNHLAFNTPGFIALSPGDAEAVRVTGGGNVGIGTTSPDTPLFVQGGASGTGGWNRTATLSATYPGLIFNSNGTKWGGMAYDYSAAMRFWVNASNNDIFAGTLAMSILNSGNVGIGTTAPSAYLHLKGGMSYGSFRISPSIANGESAMAFFTDVAGTTTANAWVIGHAGWGHTGDFVIGNQANGGPVMLMQQNGNVGIGTTAPNAKLEVAGDTRFGSGAFKASTDQTFSSTGQYNFRDGVSIWNPNGLSAVDTTAVMSIGSMSNGISLSTTGQINASGGNSGNWNTAYGWGNHASQGYATQTYVNTAVSNLVASAPGTLDTLNELAAALGDDPNFATTVTNSIATKLPLSGGTITTSANYGVVVNHSPALGDFVDALTLRSTTSGQRAQIGFATVGTDGDHHRASIRAYKGNGNFDGVFGIALRQTDATHVQRFTLTSTGNLTIDGQMNVSGGNSSNWNTAYSWGNHASQGYLTNVTNISGYSGALQAEDNRTISPSELGTNRLSFGFTSWANNNNTPYADFLHLRSYGDGSGGNDNLIMFLKSGIGMRIWQQGFGSTAAYSSYKDVAWTDGTNASGTWGINISGNAATVTNFSGTHSGASSGTNTGDQTNISGNAATATSSVNLIGLGAIQSTTTGTSYTANYQVRENLGGGGNYSETYAPQLAFHWSGIVASSIMMEASGRIAIRNNPGGSYENFAAAVITATGGNSTNWNTAYGWGNHASAGYQAASTAITTSNIGSQSVNFANSSTSAAYLNYTGVGGTQINANTFGYGRASNYYGTGQIANSPESAYASLYNFGGADESALSLQMFASVNHNDTASTRNLWFRVGNNLGFQNDWKQLIHSGNIGSQSVSYAATAGSAPNAGNANSFYNVTAGEGYGLRLWSDDSYKISMGVSSVYQYGPVNDYSIKTQMDTGSTGRGFTWGTNGVVPIAALNSTSGDMQIAGSLRAAGHLFTSYNGGNILLRSADNGGGTGILLQNSGGSFKFQIYGNGSDYGFLNGNWAGWDIRKAVSGAMYMNGDNTYYLQTNSTSNFVALNIEGNAVVHAGNIGSQSVNYATSAGNSGTVTNGVYTNATNTIINGDSPGLILYGASSYDAAAALHLGGWSTDTTYARIRTSNGNLHIDTRGGAGNVYQMYFNHYSSGDMYFGNGGGTVYIYGGRLKHSNGTSYVYESGTWGISITGNAATATSAGNADTVDGYHETSFIRIAANSSSPTNASFAIGSASGRNFIQSHSGQPLDLNPLGNTVTVGSTLTISGTVSASNLSGTNTGDQTNISGNAARATRANGNFYIDDNYGNTIVGNYSSYRYQGVFAMGDSYKLSADGTSSGALYGIAWTHTNVGGESKSGLGHQALFMANGSTQTAIGYGIWTSGLITTTSYGTSANWNTAYGWGNHASAGYQAASTAITTSNIGSQTVASAGNATTAGGLAVHGGRNNEANKIVRTDVNGYLQAGWINTTSGAFSNAINKIYCSDDDYMRYQTPANFISNLGLITTSNIGSQSVSYASSAGSVAWGTITSRPDWMAATSLIATHSNANAQVNSGFYENAGGGSNWPTQTWYNSINVRHSNQGNYHGFQMAMSYYDNNLWFRSYQGSGTFQTWAYAISSQNIGSQSVSYATTAGTASNISAYTINQSVGTGNAPTFTDVYVNDWFRNNNVNEGLYNQSSGNHFYSKTAGLWAITGAGAGVELQFRSNHESTIRGYVYGDTNSNFGLLNSVGGWSVRCLPGSGYGGALTGTWTASGDIIAFSDARVKENVETIDNALDKVLALRGVTYNRTDLKDTSKKIGVIAQEVQKILPEVVQEQEDGMLGVSYGNIVGVLIEAIKEQQKQIDELKALLK